jgi:hypothetical protein
VRRDRLRPAHSAERLAEIYARPHDHTKWPDHMLRVDATNVIAKWAVGPVHSAADLSCGDGAILSALDAQVRHFGDFAPGYEYTGPLDETLDQIPHVDAYVCSETLEHLDEPEPILAKIRRQSACLVLSTPVDAWGDHNPEHYWAWDREAVEAMLTAAGWKPIVYSALDIRPANGEYCFGIWVCR